MPQKMFSLLFIVFFATMTIAQAQLRYRIRGGGRRGGADRQQAARHLPPFKPTVNLSVGYGFPALDRYYLPEFYNLYSGDVSQKGPFTGSLDYQFSRRMSVGLMVTYNKIDVPYHYYYSSLPAFTGKFETTSFMINLTRYIPVSRTVTPYFKTAIGFNTWKQDYTDPDGNKVNVATVDMPAFAYQVALGARFNLSQHAGLFVEAGYGKYIAQGGLTLRF